MTPKELRGLLEPVMLDKSLTMEQKREKFPPLINRLMRENALTMTVDEMFDLWNNIMADICEENGIYGPGKQPSLH